MDSVDHPTQSQIEINNFVFDDEFGEVATARGHRLREMNFIFFPPKSNMKTLLGEFAIPLQNDKKKKKNESSRGLSVCECRWISVQQAIHYAFNDLFAFIIQWHPHHTVAHQRISCFHKTFASTEMNHNFRNEQFCTTCDVVPVDRLVRVVWCDGRALLVHAFSFHFSSTASTGINCNEVDSVRLTTNDRRRKIAHHAVASLRWLKWYTSSGNYRNASAFRFNDIVWVRQK